MRSLFAAALIALPCASFAQETTPVDKIPLAEVPVASAISAEIGATGMGATLARLAALPAPTAEERFARAGLEFLTGLEGLIKLSAATNLPRDLGFFIPALGFGMAPQEAAPALPPGAVNAAFEAFAAAMTRASDTLGTLPEGADLGFALDFRDLWFDLDGDGLRGPDEEAAPMLSLMVTGRFAAERTEEWPPIVRFDTADAAWLSAYAHVLAGGAEMMLAFDIEPSLAKARSTHAAMEALAGETGVPPLDDFDDWIDPAAIIVETLSHQPDPAHTRAAAAHWRAMIAENTRFWSLVAQETDNQAEWIPNDAQLSMLGFDFPQGLGATWQQVLADGAALLDGRLTLPFWRSDAVGIDAAAWLENPAPLDLAGLVQGWALAPYLSAAPVIDAQSWRQFEALVGRGQGTFMAITLN